uniref:HTH cro/C1-type domain-containing protein n=1 Tax=Solibacter usitatus (strain Ellin6076) TaxID=234267 RepID=Q01YH3_SOLUE
MSATLLDASKYRELLNDTLPLVIHDEAEYQRLLHGAGKLMEKVDDETTEEEGRLLEMLSMLIEEYEDRVHPLPATSPHKMLQHLLQEKGLRPSGLWDLIPKSRVSEILSGRRSISKAQAKKLAARFKVPVELFL